jgi:hypothetical protein
MFRLAVIALKADSGGGKGISLQHMTYLYETIPASEGGEVRRYEIRQSIHDPALTRHPETGEPVRRVIVGGLGLITGKSESARPPVRKPAYRGCGCGRGGCGH